MDQAMEVKIRELQRENRIAKDKDLKKLEFLQGSDPHLSNLEEDIDSLQSDLIIYENSVSAKYILTFQLNYFLIIFSNIWYSSCSRSKA